MFSQVSVCQLVGVHGEGAHGCGGGGGCVAGGTCMAGAICVGGIPSLTSPSMYSWKLKMDNINLLWMQPTHSPLISSTSFFVKIWHLTNYNSYYPIQVQVYRFSLSWSRLLPDGTLDGGVNQDGIEFYQTFISALIENGTAYVKMTSNYNAASSLQKT